MTEVTAAGSQLEGTVLKLLPYGMLIELPDSAVGLVHISEIADAFIKDIANHYQIGDKVRVKVLRTDEQGRYVLSVRQAADRDGEPSDSPPVAEAPASAAFEDKLTRFLKESQERQRDVKRHTEAKLGRLRK